MHESLTEESRVLTRYLERCRFRRIRKNQNLGKKKRILNTNGIQEALRVPWQDLRLTLLVGFWGGDQALLSQLMTSTELERPSPLLIKDWSAGEGVGPPKNCVT